MAQYGGDKYYGSGGARQTDEFGNPVRQTDEFGNLVGRQTDEWGNPVRHTDEWGNPVSHGSGGGVTTEHYYTNTNAPTEPVGGTYGTTGTAAYATTGAADQGVLGGRTATTGTGKHGTHGGLTAGRKEEHGTLGGILHRSGSSSSSSEDDGHGGRRKKGLKEKIKEKLPGSGNKQQQGEHHVYDHRQPQPTAAVTNPSGATTNLPSAEAGGYGYGGDQQHHEKGFMEKIKEKLPGGGHH